MFTHPARTVWKALIQTLDQLNDDEESHSFKHVWPSHAPKRTNRDSVCFLINFNRETVFEHTDWKQHFIFGESFILQSKVPPQISTSS